MIDSILVDQFQEACVGVTPGKNIEFSFNSLKINFVTGHKSQGVWVHTTSDHGPMHTISQNGKFKVDLSLLLNIISF